MEDDVKVFGFWIYLMTDLVIFGVLFAVYLVLRNSTFGGPTGPQLFELPVAFAETILLLVSSFTCSLVTLALHSKQKKRVIFWLAVTFVLGASFLALELLEFSKFVHMGADPQRSGFLSAYFTLVGTHGLHISVGLVWMAVAIVTATFRKLTPMHMSQMYRLAYFWHFLDVVWVFIFTVVYGMAHL